MKTFNLIDEPWLPCLTRAGRSIEVGLRDVIEHCHEYRELFDPSPLVTIALHRLLLALVRRIYGIRSESDWHGLRSAGRFSAAAATRYFSRYADRFDLFHPERPFMQSRLMPGVKAHPVARLIREMASGNNPTLFDHSCDAEPEALAPAEAARRLVAAQATSLGGGVSEPFNFCDATLARDSTALLYGSSLYETLLLNLPPQPVDPGDAPVWEWNEEPAPQRAGTTVPGMMAMFTWPARRIRLVADGATGRVIACQVLQGLVAAPGQRDPQKAYQSDPLGNLTPLRLAPRRVLWRDLPVWLGHVPDAVCPDAIAWQRHCHAGRGSGQSLQLAIFGVATSPGRASVSLWPQDRFPLPSLCLDDSETVHEFTAAQNRTEACAAALAASVTFLAKLLRLPAEASATALSDAGLNYWAELDRSLRGYLLAAASDPVGATATWDRQIAAAATTAFTIALTGLGRLAGHERATAIARRFLAQRLAAIMEPASRRGGERGAD